MNKGRVRLGEVCRLAGDLQVRMAMSDRVARKGPYPLYAENCMKYGIDDYAIEAGGTVMVSAIGQVVTSAGTLVAMLEPGRCSASEHVHALIPHDPADAAYLWRVISTSPHAARSVTGSAQLRQLGGGALISTPIPWPSREQRDAFVARLEEFDQEKARLSDLVPELYAKADAAFVEQVVAASDERTRVSEVCRFERGTDVPATLRANDKPVRVEGPSGILGHCDEALSEEPLVAVGPSGRRLLSHYVDEPSHPIAEMAYVTQGGCDVPLPVLLFALRHAGLPDRLRVNGKVVGTMGLTVDGLGDVELALGTEQARADFTAYAQQIVDEICAAQHRMVACTKERAEYIAAFFKDDSYESAELPAPRGKTAYAPAMGSAKGKVETADPTENPALGPLAAIVKEQSFELAPDDLAWELAPLAVVRACLDEDGWAKISAAAQGDACGLVGAIDEGLATLAGSDDLLEFMPNLSYASSLLKPEQLAQWVRALDAIAAAEITGAVVRATFDLSSDQGALPAEVGTIMAGTMAALAGDAEVAYVPVESQGLAVDLFAQALPEVTLRAQFDDFSHMLATAMVRAAWLRDARETRGGLGAAAGDALAADEFADWKAPLVCAVLPPNAGQWCDHAPSADDPRWVLGTPPRNKANFAWLQLALSHQEKGGATVLLICSSALHSTSGSEPALRHKLVDGRRVRLVCSLPARIFGDDRPSMSMLVMGDEGCSEQILFVDALGLGEDIDGAAANMRPQRRLPAKTAQDISQACAAWLADGTLPGDGLPARVVGIEEVQAADDMLTPWTYVEEQA